MAQEQKEELKRRLYNGKHIGNSLFFKSFSVSGDKITIHKCVIDEAIKQVKNNMDPFESGDRVAGKLDILTDLSEAISREIHK